MVRRSLTSSRTEAQRLIQENQVLVRGIPTPKPSSLVATGTPIELVPTGRRWVSRGALKLLGALETFPVEVAGKRAIDIGSSTGGFTEVLLDAGAVEVLALDVGRAQLHESLLAHPRVVSLERTNFRLVDPADLGGPFQLLVGDLSFISLCAVAANIAGAVETGADTVLLVKPQFEAGRGQVGRGGIVSDPDVRRGAVLGVIECLESAGLGSQGLMRSPIAGGDGNVEYLLWSRKGADAVTLEVPD
jgi:23S rRNA (cytidine1920-2'-O)/16S rRNA (cytidine1409-2'-O)-methyltransferase